MIVHIFADTPHHYLSMADYFQRLPNLNEKQLFWAQFQPNVNPNESFSYYHSPKHLKEMLNELAGDVQLVIHGNFNPRVWLMLLFHPLASKASCVFWGADLYRYQTTKMTFKQKVVQLIHRLLCKRYKHLVCLNSGDAVLVDKYLKRSNAKVIPYPLQQSYLDNLKNQAEGSNKPENHSITILVGNSAAASNNHLEVFEQLKHLVNEDIQVLCTLNYAGTKEYISHVIKEGKSIFGNKFTAITDMLSKDDHAKLLADVDLCIFGHNRQQGLFVAYAMFALGKPVFMKSQVSSYQHLTNLGFTVHKTDELSRYSWQSLNSAIGEDKDNTKVLEQTYTEQALAPKWLALLSTSEAAS